MKAGLKVGKLVGLMVDRKADSRVAMRAVHSDCKMVGMLGF